MLPAMSAVASPSESMLHHRRAWWDGLIFVFLLAVLAYQVAGISWLAAAGISPLIVAIVLGALYANVLPGTMPAQWSAGVNFAARRLLRIAVALYGLRIGIQELLSVGVPGLSVAVIMVLGTLGLGVLLGRLLRLDRETTLLAAAGSAICGAAAVLAFESTLRARPEKSAVAVATVVLFGTLSMFLYPVLYHAGFFPMSAAALGVFIGGSVHEVAQVVAAASAIDSSVVQAATIVKMARVAMLVPLLLLLGAWLAHKAEQPVAEARAGAGSANAQPHGKAQRPRLPIPWFALGFLACILLASSRVIPQDWIQHINRIDTFALTMAMAALGVETRWSKMRQAGPRVLVLAALLFVWLLVGGYWVTTFVMGA